MHAVPHAPSHTPRRARIRLCALATLVASLALVLPTSAVAAPAFVPGSASPAEFVPAAAATRSTSTARTVTSKAASRGGDPWSWSSTQRSWVASNRVLPAALVARGPATALTRGQFVAAIAALEDYRARTYGTPRLLASSAPGRTFPDASAASLGARAISLGWLAPVAGRYAGSAPITANDAALAMAGVLGERSDVVALALKLRSEVPGPRIAYTYAAAHALTRTLGLRFNVLEQFDAYELGPTEAVNVAHGSYMLATAAGNLGWKFDEAHRLASGFDLPTLGANQAAILSTAIRQLGQPYIWAGETEGKQAEGHGGFDCSGFAIRVINSSGVPATALSAIGERTTYTQSAIGAHIARAQLQPGDAIYFGDHGARSTPSQNYHAGVYMGNGWFIHSSGGNGGVAINSLDGWWGGQFAWGRRALRTP